LTIKSLILLDAPKAHAKSPEWLDNRLAWFFVNKKFRKV